MVTVVGTLGVSGGALALFPTGHLLAGVIVCTVFVFADMLDGAMARIRAAAARGARSWTPPWTGSPTPRCSPASRRIS